MMALHTTGGAGARAFQVQPPLSGPVQQKAAEKAWALLNKRGPVGDRIRAQVPLIARDVVRDPDRGDALRWAERTMMKLCYGATSYNRSDHAGHVITVNRLLLDALSFGAIAASRYDELPAAWAEAIEGTLPSEWVTAARDLSLAEGLVQSDMVSVQRDIRELRHDVENGAHAVGGSTFVRNNSAEIGNEFVADAGDFDASRLTPDDARDLVKGAASIAARAAVDVGLVRPHHVSTEAFHNAVGTELLWTALSFDESPQVLHARDVLRAAEQFVMDDLVKSSVTAVEKSATHVELG